MMYCLRLNHLTIFEVGLHKMRYILTNYYKNIHELRQQRTHTFLNITKQMIIKWYKVNKDRIKYTKNEIL